MVEWIIPSFLHNFVASKRETDGVSEVRWAERDIYPGLRDHIWRSWTLITPFTFSNYFLTD